MSSAPEKGASIQVVTDATKLRERADQSTWPSVGVDEDGNQAVTRGPHNIVRTCCEFALEERGRCEVFVGSPAEICATARRRVTPTVEGSALLFIDSLEELPVLPDMTTSEGTEKLQAAIEQLQNRGEQIELNEEPTEEAPAETSEE